MITFGYLILTFDDHYIKNCYCTCNTIKQDPTVGHFKAGFNAMSPPSEKLWEVIECVSTVNERSCDAASTAVEVLHTPCRNSENVLTVNIIDSKSNDTHTQICNC